MRGKNTSKLKFSLALVALLLFHSASAWAGKPRCFLHGIMAPAYDNKDKSILSNMLRMQFDADSPAKCEQMLTAYCQYNIREKGYSPSRLKATYKPDVDASEEVVYSLSDTCKITEK